MEKDKAVLEAIQKICAGKGEADAADIAGAAGITAAEAEACIRRLGEDDLAIVIEIDLCCGEEYIVKGLTEQGEAYLRDNG